jgi:hypothetical protein
LTDGQKRLTYDRSRLVVVVAHDPVKRRDERGDGGVAEAVERFDGDDCDAFADAGAKAAEYGCDVGPMPIAVVGPDIFCPAIPVGNKVASPDARL